MLIGLTILLRCFSFFTSVLDHDESTYIVIAQQMLLGKTYLIDVLDTKPVGIFLIYAGMLQLVGDAIPLLRLIPSIWIGLTAFLLFRLGERTSGSRSVAWAAGLLYPLYCSSWAHYGISPNTELYYNLFTVAAVSLVWDARQRFWPHLLAGILLGTAFLIKYTVAADAFAIGLLVLYRGYEKQQWVRAIFWNAAPMTLVFFLPIAICAYYYLQIDALDTFYHYTFEITSRYPVERTWLERLIFLLDFVGRFAPMSLLAIFAAIYPVATDRVWQRFLLVWLTCVAIMVILPGKRFGHYHIQLMPAASLLAASFFHPDRVRYIDWQHRAWRILAVFYLVVLFLNWNGHRNRPDKPQLVVDYVAPLLEEGDLVYPGDFHQIIYFLLDQEVLSPYVHSSLLFSESHIQTLEVDVAAEAARILAQEPRFILVEPYNHQSPLKQLVYKNYRKRATIEVAKVEVWEKRE